MTARTPSIGPASCECAKADPGLSAHALRHAAGSAAANAGFSLPTVQDIRGHSSVAITGDIYSHPPEACARAAVDDWAR